MANFTRFTTFPIFYHQSISFLQKSQQILVRGGYIVKFFNFLELFHTKGAPNDPQWQIWPKKWLRLGQNGQFWSFCRFFPQREAGIDSEWPISPNSQLFPSFSTKASHFCRNLKNFHFWGEGTLANFFEFFNFFKLFYTKGSPNDPQWQIWPKKCLGFGQIWPILVILQVFPPK